MIIGAPTGQLGTRIVISLLGIALVTFCLITGESEGNVNSSFIIGGSLLGLILTSTPFISFYSRKNFRILVSRKLRQISITKRIYSPDQRIDFSNIEFLQLKHLQVDDLISGSIDDNAISFMHTFSAVSESTITDLFSLTSEDDDMKAFVEQFGIFLANFAGKELKLLKA